MANTLSQYIGQIIDRRNQELQQRLAPLIPLLQADLAEEKKRGEVEQMRGEIQKYMTAAYGEEAGQAFSTGAADLTTAESLVSWQKTFESRQETAATAKEYISMLRARGVPISQEKEQQYMSIQDPAVLKTSITMDIDGAPMTDAAADGAALTNLRPAFKKKYDDLVAGGTAHPTAYVEAFYQQELAEHKATHPPSGGGGGRGSNNGGGQQAEQYSSTEEIKKQIANVYYVEKGGGYVKQYGANGGILKIPATVGSDGRLYVKGNKGVYLVHPSNYIPSTETSNSITLISRGTVDIWNSGTHESGNTEQTKTQNNPAPANTNQKYPGVRVIKKN